MLCNTLISTQWSSANFVATFQRFVSRRGWPLNVYSDNGTNFVGAMSELEMFLQENQFIISQTFERERISWHFIPANKPHFGGL